MRSVEMPPQVAQRITCHDEPASTQILLLPSRVLKGDCGPGDNNVPGQKDSPSGIHAACDQKNQEKAKESNGTRQVTETHGFIFTQLFLFEGKIRLTPSGRHAA